MSINGEIYCNACLLHIGIQKHAALPKPGTKGESPEDYLHYHNRAPDDCWRKLQKKSSGNGPTAVADTAGRQEWRQKLAA